MRKYRILHKRINGKMKFQVQKKFLCFWLDDGEDCGDYTLLHAFLTLEEAQSFIRDNYSPVVERIIPV